MRGLKSAVRVVAVLLFTFSLSMHSLAATPTSGISLQISPLPIELNAKPGTSVGSDLRVRNAGTSTEKLQVRLSELLTR